VPPWLTEAEAVAEAHSVRLPVGEAEGSGVGEALALAVPPAPLLALLHAVTETEAVEVGEVREEAGRVTKGELLRLAPQRREGLCAAVGLSRGDRDTLAEPEPVAFLVGVELALGQALAEPGTRVGEGVSVAGAVVRGVALLQAVGLGCAGVGVPGRGLGVAVCEGQAESLGVGGRVKEAEGQDTGVGMGVVVREGERVMLG
jgi:hypothetical protein